jgi:hypothetical protein
MSTPARCRAWRTDQIHLRGRLYPLLVVNFLLLVLSVICLICYSSINEFQHLRSSNFLCSSPPISINVHSMSYGSRRNVRYDISSVAVGPAPTRQCKFSHTPHYLIFREGIPNQPFVMSAGSPPSTHSDSFLLGDEDPRIVLACRHQNSASPAVDSEVALDTGPSNSDGLRGTGLPDRVDRPLHRLRVQPPNPPRDKPGRSIGDRSACAGLTGTVLAYP